MILVALIGTDCICVEQRYSALLIFVSILYYIKKRALCQYNNAKFFEEMAISNDINKKGKNMEAKLKSYYIRIAFRDMAVRIIRVSGSNNLFTLARAIMAAFETEYDTPFAFIPDFTETNGKPDFEHGYFDPRIAKDNNSCNDVTVAEAYPNMEDKFMFVKIFNDGALSFDCRVTDIFDRTTTKPGLIQEIGRSPFGDSDKREDLKYLRRVMLLHPIDFRPDDPAYLAVQEISSMDEGELQDLPNSIADAISNAIGYGVFTDEVEGRIKKAYDL